MRPLAPPPREGIDHEFAAGLEQEEFRIQRCRRCDAVRWPATSRCPMCSSPDHRWFAASGHGRLWSWIVMHHHYFPEAAAQLPYAVGFIELAEGPMVMARLTDEGNARCDAAVSFDAENSRIAEIPVFAVAEPASGSV